MTRKYSQKTSEKVERTLHEWKRGKLRSGSGGKVTSQKQAIAIGLSQARRAGYKVPPIAHATKYRPKYGNDPGDWQRGFDYGSDAARHDGSPRETLGQLAEHARTDFDRGHLAAYQAIFGRGPKAKTSYARKKKSPAELERDIAIKELSREREQLLNALGYAGNTPEQVRKYHAYIAEVDAKIRALK